jgi:hypothetical protein
MLTFLCCALITEEVCGGRVRCITYTTTTATTTTTTAAAVSDTDKTADVNSGRCNGQLVSATSNGHVHVWTLNWSESSLEVTAAETAATAETDETSEHAAPLCTITVAATKTVLGEPRCVASVFHNQATFEQQMML